MWTTHFHEPEPAELLVGLYEQWVSSIEYGHTQADRVLIHTDIMATAHERRFAISESRQTLDYSAEEHCARIKSWIETLHDRFDAATTGGLMTFTVDKDDNHLSVSSIPDTEIKKPHDCLIEALPNSVAQAASSAAGPCELPRPCCGHSRKLISIDSSAASNESDDGPHESLAEALRSIQRKRARSRSSSPSDSKPRQLKAVRCRKDGPSAPMSMLGNQGHEKLSVKFLVT